MANETPQSKPMLRNIREQIKTLREKQEAVSAQDLDTLKKNIAALPENERGKITAEVHLLLDNLSATADIKIRLADLEERFRKLEQGPVTRGAESGGAYLGEKIGQGASSVWSAGKSAVNPETWKEIWRTSNQSTASKIIGGGIAGYLLYRFIRYFKGRKNPKQPKPSFGRRILRAASWILGGTLLFNTFGKRAEERASQYAKLKEQDATRAQQYAAAHPRGGELFGADRSIEEVNLTQLNVPFTVAGQRVQFERAASGEILWVVNNKKFRVVSQKSWNPTTWGGPSLGKGLSGVSRVTNTEIIRFRAGGSEYYVARGDFERVISGLAVTTAPESNQAISIMENPANPTDTKAVGLKFALAPEVTPAPAAVAAGSAPVRPPTS